MGKCVFGTGKKMDTYRSGKKGGALVASGVVWVKNARFEYSIKEQRSGASVYKGSVRAVDATGETLKKGGMKKKQILGKYDGKELSKNELDQKLRLSKSVVCDTLDQELVLNAVRKKAEKLFLENPGTIIEAIWGNVTSETITLQIAVEEYGYEFVQRVFPASNPERQEKLEKQLKNLSEKFEARPMATYPKTRITKIIEGLGEKSVDILRKFWDYCLERGICDGENPIVAKKKKKPTEKQKQLRAMRCEEISEDQINALLDDIEKDPTGPSMGTALMISGFKPSFLADLCWKDIHVREGNSYVVVTNIHMERAGGTQDFSRPVLPRVADVIKMRLSRLKSEYDATTLAGMPVVSTVNDPTKKMASQAIIQTAVRMLKAVSVTNMMFAALRAEDQTMAAATKLLSKSYARLLTEKSNIFSDTGTFNFLTDTSLGSDTTSKNYTSFTSKSGEARLHDILMSAAKVKKHRKKRDVAENDHKTTVTVYPDFSDEYAVMKGQIVVPPGGVVYITCKHGVEGSYTAAIPK